MLRQPVFISGLRKSGTSMVRNLLDGHPDLFVTPWNEVHVFKFTHFDHVLMQMPGSEQKTFSEYIEDVCNDRWFNPKPAPDGRPKSGKRRNLDFDRFKELLRARTDEVHDYPSLFEAILRTMAGATYCFEGRDPDAIRFTCKGVQQTEYFPELLAWYPDIKFIYVLRSPYGQLNSAINNQRHNREGVAKKHEINRDYKKLDKKLPYPYLGRRLKDMKLSYYFARKFASLHPKNFYVLVYDRLLASPEEEMRKLSEFLGIEFTPHLLELTQCGYPCVRQGWSVGVHADNKVSTRPLHAWKEQLPGAVIRLVNMYFGRVLDEYGFERVESKDIKWKRFDRSERLRVYIANRILFTKAAASLLPM